jgi:hypothetical protein
VDRTYRGRGAIREGARTGYVQAPAFDPAVELLEEVLRQQPGVGVEEEDQISRSGVASEAPATRDGQLTVEDRLHEESLAMRTVASWEPASTTMTSSGFRLWRRMSESSPPKWRSSLSAGITTLKRSDGPPSCLCHHPLTLAL